MQQLHLSVASASSIKSNDLDVVCKVAFDMTDAEVVVGWLMTT